MDRYIHQDSGVDFLDALRASRRIHVRVHGTMYYMRVRANKDNKEQLAEMHGIYPIAWEMNLREKCIFVG